MKPFLSTIIMMVVAMSATASSDYDTNFCDSTLRVNYVFGGGPDGRYIMLDNQSKTAGWFGRRKNLDTVPIQGNGQIAVLDPVSGDTLYVNSFSSLYHEWVNTPEAKEVNRSFANSFLLPLPKKAADISITLFDSRRQPMSSMKHRYRPNDELVALPAVSGFQKKYIHKGGDPEKAIDVAMISEGYTSEEAEAFFADAERMAAEVLSYEPFSTNKDKFNFLAVMVPSKDSGVSVPLDKIWKDTALGSHFSTFYMSRYLTIPNVDAIHDALNGLPYEHVIVLANTDRYGGGGIYNCYQIATVHNPQTLPVTVHEFGHSFAGLADEYFYDDYEDESTYPLDIEPWEPNITTLVDFDSKWSDMIEKDVPVPTPWKDKGGTREERRKNYSEEANAGCPAVGVYEGGGYRKQGVYRPAVTCRMRDNYNPTFCPVCRRAVERIITFYGE